MFKNAEYRIVFTSSLGNVGFNLLGFSENFNLKWLHESELKHDRAAMLATVGFIVQQFVTLPGITHVTDSNIVPQATNLESILQFVFEIGIIKFWINKGNVTIETMFEDSDHIPGDFKRPIAGA